MSSFDPHPGPPASFDLERFIEAQASTYEIACRELRAGRKESHWMWFVFPQMRGLGRSSKAQHFGIGSLAEARAYLAHPLLGPRLRYVTTLLLALPQGPVRDILGSPDDMKLQSSMTLFEQAAKAEGRGEAREDTGDPSPFRAVLDRYFGGAPDPTTLRLIGAT
jgi:uncharacterized protein (DUF1810 family)